ncbi:MAG: type II secretion system protein [Verrucomicrobiota bacterium]
MPHANCREVRGFSLIEIVLVFALIGVATAVTIVNFDMLGESGNSEPPENVALHAIRTARIAAISEQEWTYLSWNKEERAFEISTLNGNVVEKIVVERGVSANEDPLEVIFESPASEFHNRTPFEFRQDVGSPLKRIAFSPQRASTPFILRILDGSIEYSRRIDPFSSLPIQPEEASR